MLDAGGKCLRRTVMMMKLMLMMLMTIMTQWCLLPARTCEAMSAFSHLLLARRDNAL